MRDTGTVSLLPFTRKISLHAQGRFGGGGVVVIGQDGQNRPVILSPVLFDLLAILIRNALENLPQGMVPAAAFQSVNQLCAELRRQTRDTDNPLDPDPPNLAKYVFRLRGALEDHDLLEYKRHLGYRLSTPPDKLTLILLDQAAKTRI